MSDQPNPDTPVDAPTPAKGPPKEPTTTHICLDGSMRPGKGPHGRGADRCPPCFRKYLKERRHARQAGMGRKPGIPSLNMDGSATIKHGFYRKKLTAEEARLAERLHKAFYEQYQLDPLADDILVNQLVVNIVKSQRPEPKGPDGHARDKNVRDYQAYYERNVREAMAALGLTRRERRDDGKKEGLREAIGALFGQKKEPGSTLNPSSDPDLQPAP